MMTFCGTLHVNVDRNYHIYYTILKTLHHRKVIKRNVFSNKGYLKIVAVKRGELKSLQVACLHIPPEAFKTSEVKLFWTSKIAT